ncbi:RNA deprotection pyrophosphohydrolase [Gracilibacillus alcaliphilus]|uniref:RNA deprotection pyrophosphohydrolase n=1 Tax=Gracilibacillus alcaliphilus TaxID=1401441 RepID=UPI00195BAD5B|nr:nucleoside triphosphatase YtkD [Gracilibacillus alcaliphilus]MBM7675851.1 8-oxo-dGTP diphosphatase [Gracilibacillus alcaliphilus]
MKTFYDFYNNKVQLSFGGQAFESDPKHVWVICRLDGQWLLTKHKDRGLEFPGGKVEPGETPQQAAIREVKEETGGLVKDIRLIGQYYVAGKRDQLAKNIYYAVIDRLEAQNTYYETEGPVLLQSLPADLKKNNQYSFIMKDDVLPYSLAYISRLDHNHKRP